MHKDEGQVVILGAGFDTSYWNLSEDLPLSWVEVDFGAVISRKIRSILLGYFFIYYFYFYKVFFILEFNFIQTFYKRSKKILQDKLKLNSEEVEQKSKFL